MSLTLGWCIVSPVGVFCGGPNTPSTDRADTQPTRSRWEELPDSLSRRVLRGTKSGNGAWALAWVDTVLELPEADVDVEPEGVQADDLPMSLVGPS